MNKPHHPEPKAKMNILELFFNNGTTKSLAITALVAVGGWTANTLINAHGQSDVLATHTQQLDKLWMAQGETSKAIASLSLTTAQISGKIDVLGQKIDDDRAAKAATVHRFGAPALGTGVPAEEAAVTK